MLATMKSETYALLCVLPFERFFLITCSFYAEISEKSIDLRGCRMISDVDVGAVYSVVAISLLLRDRSSFWSSTRSSPREVQAVQRYREPRASGDFGSKSQKPRSPRSTPHKLQVSLGASIICRSSDALSDPAQTAKAADGRSSLPWLQTSRKTFMRASMFSSLVVCDLSFLPPSW